ELNPGGTYLERDTLGRKMLEVITNGDTLVYRGGKLDYVKKFGSELMKLGNVVVGCSVNEEDGSTSIYGRTGELSVRVQANGDMYYYPEGGKGKPVFIPGNKQIILSKISGNEAIMKAGEATFIPGYLGYMNVDKTNNRIEVKNQYNETVISVDMKTLQFRDSEGNPLERGAISRYLSQEQLFALGESILKAIDSKDMNLAKYEFGKLSIKDELQKAGLYSTDSPHENLVNFYFLLKENPSLMNHLAEVSPKMAEYRNNLEQIEFSKDFLSSKRGENTYAPTDTTYIERLYISLTSIPEVTADEIKTMIKNRDIVGVANVNFEDLAPVLFSLSLDDIRSQGYSAEFVLDLRKGMVNKMKEYPELFNFGKFQMDDISFNNMTDLYYSSSLESGMLQYYAIQKKESELRVKVFESLVGEDKRIDILSNSSLGDNRAYAVIRGFEGDPMAVRAWAEMTEFLLNGRIDESGWFRDPLIDAYVGTFNNFNFDVTELKEPFQKDLTFGTIGEKILSDWEKKAAKDYIVAPSAKQVFGEVSTFVDIVKQYTTIQKGYSYYQNIEAMDDVQEYSMLTSVDRLVLKEFEAGKFGAYGSITLGFKTLETYLPAGGLPGILAAFGLKAVESVIKTTVDTGISAIQQDYYNNAVERNLNELQMTPESNTTSRTFVDYFRDKYVNERVEYRVANPEITNSVGYTRQELINEETYRCQVYYVQDINTFYQQFFEAYDYNHRNEGSSQQ
ncbi:MAG: hypothetical protein JXB24_00010, partial [Bacteroidales bacterium]|nr:hypothetical protein [Bacteroidales bacterium]